MNDRKLTLKSCAVRGPKGEKGEDVLEFAQKGGYAGTEQELAEALAKIRQAIPMIVTATVVSSEPDSTGIVFTDVELSESFEDIIGAITDGRYVAVDLDYDGHMSRLHVTAYTADSAEFSSTYIADTEMQDGTICNLYVSSDGPATGHYSIT